MTVRRAVTGVLGTVMIAAAMAATWWISTAALREGKKPEPAAAPAIVSKPLKEDQINSITLSADAVARLNLRVGKVERKAVRQWRTYGGEITIPPGQAMIVSAPVSGILKSPEGGLPKPGHRVERGQVIFSLLPLLSPESRVTLAAAKVDADGQIKSAQIQVEAGLVTLNRAKRVFQSEAGSRRAVDDAMAQYRLAQKALDAAIARRDLLQQALKEGQGGTADPLSITSPGTGMLRNISAQPEQSVPSGAALFEVVDLDMVWVRVAVYVGDLPAIDQSSEASIAELTAEAGRPGTAVRPVIAPPSANAATGTLDLFYGLDNRQPRFSPGQRVAARLALKGEAESLTVPWSAVIFDIYGGNWLYEQTADRTYVRRRIFVRYVNDGTAVLASGPDAGTEVVIAGAAELFGTETGFSK